MQETIWSLIPPIIAIGLALATKEVYFSLFIGILSGALFYTNFSVSGSLETVFGIMSQKVGDNINIIIFLVLLGMLVALMFKSGASKAYGDWASKSIKTKKGALFATAGLGALIFVDDYFNCLTVGTVMSPVTDKHKISRAKLAYIIDATAAPVCIIAPISSWAAAVGSSLPENSSIDGFNLFIKTIPFNFYAILTLIMVVFIIYFDFDFSKMKAYELNHKNDSLKTNEVKQEAGSRKGKVIDLVIPIVCLIVFCILAMVYTGGILEGANIIDAFANCNSSLSLAMGSFFTIVAVAILYLPRKVVSFEEFAQTLVDGFKAMVPAILILTFAWTLSGVCSEEYLNAGGYVSMVVKENNISQSFIPAVFFLIGLGLAFATGTSWGTFSILIPIIIAIFGGVESSILVISVAAVLAGSVCGDHISPISDTTILSSTGAACNHIDHVSTQIPYALLVAAVCFVGYAIAGFTVNGWLALLICIVLLIGILYFIKKKNK